MQRGGIGLLAASLVAAAFMAVAAVAVAGNGQPGARGQDGQPGQPGQAGQAGQAGQPGQPGAAGGSVIAIGAAGSSGGSGALDVTQKDGITHVNASCSGSSGSVDFGDGVSAKLSAATGTITHVVSSSAPHQVKLTCAGSNGQSASTSVVTVGASSGRHAGVTCRTATSGIPDVIQRLLVRLGFAVCHA
jgi:hypothetical protein